MNSMPVVFKGIVDSANYEKIRQSTKLWLIRGSETYDGMITIDFFNTNENSFESCRFAYLPKRECWIVVRGNFITKVKHIVEKINFSGIKLSIPIKGLFKKAQTMFGLYLDNLLIPKKFEASLNYKSF